EPGQGLTVRPEVAGLTFALDGHGEHEGEGVFPGSGGAGEDERVRQATGGDGGTEMLDCGGVADEAVEVGGSDYRLCCVSHLPPPPRTFVQSIRFRDFSLVLPTEFASRRTIGL